MKKIFLYSALIAVVTFGLACSTTNVLKKSTTYSFKSEPINVKYNVTLGKEIKGEATISRFLTFVVPFSKTMADNVYYTDSTAPSNEKSGILSEVLKPLSALFGGGITETAKASAAYNALKEGNFDVIIAPVYEVVYTDYYIFKTVTAKVRGRGAYLTDIMVENQIPVNEFPAARRVEPQIIPQPAPAPAVSQPASKPAARPAVRGLDKNKSYFLMLNNQKYGPVTYRQIEDLKNMGYCNNDSVLIDPETNAMFKVADLLQ